MGGSLRGRSRVLELPQKEGRMRGLQSVVLRLAVLMALLFSVQCLSVFRLVPAVTRGDANRYIARIETWLPNSEFAGVYRITSKDTLAKTIMFVEDPMFYFKLIKDVDMVQFWENVGLYDAYKHDKKKGKAEFYFREQLKNMIDWQEVPVDIFGNLVNAADVVSRLTFLFLNGPSGGYGDIIKDLYMREFRSYPTDCISELKDMKDWKLVVDRFGEENAETMKKVVKGLGKSGFEKEFKEYLLTRYPILRESDQARSDTSFLSVYMGK
jgi:hypothetical protein